MTIEEKQRLFDDIEAYKAIYETYKPLHDDGSYDKVALTNTYYEMVKKAFPDTQKAETVWQYIKSSEFSKSPASTAFHGNYENGLAVHTMQVIYQSFKLAAAVFTDYFSSLHGEEISVTADDIFVTALAHDFCKAGSYETYTKKMPDASGNWAPVKCFKFDKMNRNLGHGNESVLRLIELLPEYIHNRPVLEAVSRHMGFSDLADSEAYNYSNFLQNPLVLLVQLADQTAVGWYDR